MRKATKVLLARTRRSNGQYARDNARSGGDSRNAGRYSDGMGEYGDWHMPRSGGYEANERSLYGNNDIGFNGNGRMARGNYSRARDDGSQMNYETESRRRRDSRGRYAMEDMDGGGYRSEMNSRKGGRRNDRQMGQSEEYDDEDDMEFTELTAHEWTKAMQNEDGSKGPHWSKEQTRLFMTQVGAKEVEPLEFFAVMNAMYSDYCKIAKKYGVDKPEYYAELAKAWLEDKDAVEDKAAKYYKHVVRH